MTKKKGVSGLALTAAFILLALLVFLVALNYPKPALIEINANETYHSIGVYSSSKEAFYLLSPNAYMQKDIQFAPELVGKTAEVEVWAGGESLELSRGYYFNRTYTYVPVGYTTAEISGLGREFDAVNINVLTVFNENSGRIPAEQRSTAEMNISQFRARLNRLKAAKPGEMVDVPGLNSSLMEVVINEKNATEIYSVNQIGPAKYPVILFTMGSYEGEITVNSEKIRKYKVKVPVNADSMQARLFFKNPYYIYVPDSELGAKKNARTLYIQKIIVKA